jgi:transposase
MDDARHQAEQVTLGVDTRAEQHVAVALDGRGRRLGTCTIPTTSSGFAELLRWAGRYGELDQVGIEGTGSYGAGLSRWLRARGVAVVEVDRPDRRTRRLRGKSERPMPKPRHEPWAPMKRRGTRSSQLVPVVGD